MIEQATNLQVSHDNPSPVIDLSVVIPVYMGEASLNELCQRLSKICQTMVKHYELIWIDDNSKDNSWKVLLDLQAQDPDHIKIIRLAKNYGQHNATLCGYMHSKGQMIVSIDDDLQNQPEDIPLLYENHKHTGADLVYGISFQNNHSSFRRISSRIVRSIAQKYHPGLEKVSSFRLISRHLCDHLCKHTQAIIFIDEILNWYTSHINYVEVRHLPREKGQSGYSTFALFILTTHFIIFYTAIPLKIMTYAGLFFSVISFILGFIFICIKIFADVPVQGFTALIVSIMFGTSITMLCFGILGEYLSRIFSVINQKPMFSIKERKL